MGSEIKLLTGQHQVVATIHDGISYVNTTYNVGRWRSHCKNGFTETSNNKLNDIEKVHK